jgi:hypothetical protein
MVLEVKFQITITKYYLSSVLIYRDLARKCLDEPFNLYPTQNGARLAHTRTRSKTIFRVGLKTATMPLIITTSILPILTLW